jgi:P4 family phage/plasmid primase-like protien
MQRWITIRKACPFTPEAAEYEGLVIEKKVDAKGTADYIIKSRPCITLSDTEDTFCYDGGIYQEGADQMVKAACEGMFRQKATIHLVKEVLAHVKRSTYVDRDQLEDNGECICVQNGILNIQTGESSSFSPKRLFTKRILVRYDPAAGCPRFEKFIAEIVSPEDVELVLAMMAYCLEPGYGIQKAFVLHGQGANGKTTLLGLLRDFLGRDNVSSVPLQFLDTNRFASSLLYGKMANISSDLPSKDLYSTGRFKELTGEDQIPAEFKNKPLFQFVNRAKLIFACNTVPLTHDDSDAFYRRLIIIDFPNRFVGDRCDNDILSKLKAPEELSGLLNLLLVHLNVLRKSGTFPNALSIEQTKELYTRLSDSVHFFVEEMCTIDAGGTFEEAGVTTSSPAAKTHKEVLYSKYREYCRSIKLTPVPEKNFKKSLLSKVPSLSEGRVSSRDRRRVWIGIHLNDDTGRVSDGGQTNL